MSYEGYVQILCANGHWDMQPEPYEDSLDPCPFCGAKPAWTNHVDDTNCDSIGRIDLRLLRQKFLLSEAVQEKCSLGHLHTMVEAVYRVPTSDETEELIRLSAQGDDDA